jgi:hypothetical protein
LIQCRSRHISAKRTQEGESRGEQGTEAVEPGSQETQAEKEGGRKAVGEQGPGAKNLKTTTAGRRGRRNPLAPSRLVLVDRR